MMRMAEYFFPHDLSVRRIDIKKVLILGSCLAEKYVDKFRAINPQTEFEWLLFNNPNPLPDNIGFDLNTCDLQYIVLSLRHVVRDDVIRFGEVLNAEVAEALLARSYQMLELILESALQYNKSHGIMTVVSNFLVPQTPVIAALDQAYSHFDFAFLVTQLNKKLAELVKKHNNVFVANVESIAASLGKRWVQDDLVKFYSHAGFWDQQFHEFDTSAEYNAPRERRIEPLEPMEAIYGSRADEMYEAVWRQVEWLYRIVHQIDPVKLVIFDLDDTMWRGQIAEHYGDNTSTPVFHGWPTGIWEAVHHLRARGVIVGICSKNEESLVRDRWSRAVLPWISLDDFALREINWRPKAENIQRMIAAAGVTPASTVFVDDNPVERESVKSALKGIRCIGANPNLTKRILLWSAETNIAFRSDESANREQSIKRLQEREKDRLQLTREQFLFNLECKASISKLNSAEHPDFARSQELLNKTNQFNTTGVRWSQQQLTQFFELGGCFYVFRVTDKYTDYGLVGVILYFNGMFVQFAMSCRVLGLEVETSVLNVIMKHLNETAAPTDLFARVFDTEANMVSRDLYKKVQFGQSKDDPTLFKRDPRLPCSAAEHLSVALLIST